MPSAWRLLEVQADPMPAAAREGGIAACDAVPQESVQVGHAESRPNGFGGASERVAHGRQHLGLLIAGWIEGLGVARVTPVSTHAWRDVGQHEVSGANLAVRSVRYALRWRPERGLEDAWDRGAGLAVDVSAQGVV